MPPRKPLTRYRIRTHNIDGALRYHSVIALLRPRYRTNLRMLEVGSGAGGITEFLQHPVVGVDPAFDRTSDRKTKWMRAVPGRAEALPFDDESFDVVLSMEMLEHLPGEHREAAFSEMFRVLAPGGRMIVTFPADAVGERLDRRLNAAFRKRHGYDHPWVAEHIENGLPRTPEVRALVEHIVGDRGRVEVHKHAWAPAWMLQQGLFSAQWGFPLTFALGIHTRFGARLLWYLLRDLHVGDNCYRTMIVVDKPEAVSRAATPAPVAQAHV